MSSDLVIQLSSLSKSFGSFEAVHELNLEVFRGDVFGFLGPNGAGKSTTIRMLLSLIKPSSGEILIFGKPLVTNRNLILRRLGGIIEKPDFYLYLSAEKNLQLLARWSGKDVSGKRIQEMIELVGLKGRARDKVKTYSLGMKQRLGIAQALIHDPELIILDEPTSGLDPQGIIDVRNLIRHLHKDLAKTIFVSSHQLNEIELVATRMAIINNGKAVVQGVVTELLSPHDLVVSFEVEDVNKAKEVVLQSGWRDQMNDEGISHLNFKILRKDIPSLTKTLTENGITIYGISSKRTLEDYFLRLTNSEPTLTHA